jgi:hypothetical protein
LILKKHTQDDLKQAIAPIQKDVQSLSENLDSYIGQIESKVDQQDFERVNSDLRD